MLRHIHACQVSVIKSRLDETVWFGDMTPVRDPDDAPDILGTHFAGLPSPTRVFMHTDTSYAHTCACIHADSDTRHKGWAGSLRLSSQDAVRILCENTLKSA